ncbi:MAG: GNAT family N-acetyltransferase [Devosia sp.]
MNIRMRLPAPLTTRPAPAGHGIQLRRAADSDAFALSALLAVAFPAWSWSAERVREVLLDGPDVACTWVAISGGEIVGTASEQLIGEDGAAVGCVHWVAVAESQRGRGLGRALTAAVVEGLWRRGVTSIRLDTQDERIAAIAMYAGFGFVPEIRSADEMLAWSAVMAALVTPR